MSSANNLVNKPSLIEWGPLRLLIMDAPKESNLHLYLKQCKKSNVTAIVRISEPSYSREEVEKAGIALHVSIAVFSCSYRERLTGVFLLLHRKCTTQMGTAPRLKSSRNG
jgi:hypothetical protein